MTCNGGDLTTIGLHRNTGTASNRRTLYEKLLTLSPVQENEWTWERAHSRFFLAGSKKIEHNIPCDVYQTIDFLRDQKLTIGFSADTHVPPIPDANYSALLPSRRVSIAIRRQCQDQKT